MADPPEPTIEGPLAQIRSARDDMARALAEVDAHLAELIRQRTEMARIFEQVNKLVEQLTAPSEAADSGADLTYTTPDGIRVVVEAKITNRASPNTTAPPNVRQAILQLLATEPRAFEASEIVTGVQGMGVDAQPASIRSLLSKMAEGGEVDRPRRGMYRQARLPPPFDSKSYRVVRLPRPFHELPTPEEFMATPSVPDEEPDYDPSEYDPDKHDEYDPSEDDRSDADYQEMHREEQQAHLEDQADREETP